VAAGRHERAQDIRVDVEHGINDHGRAFIGNGLELKRSLPDQPAWVYADRVRLAQVFDNLLSNAIKFSDPGGTVRVTLTADDGSAIVRVENSGVGIREEMLERLFEPFQQDTRDIARPTGGLGLGMALAKGLVEMHDGRISAHSDGPGRGACFVVQLALAEAPRAASNERLASTSAPQRILVVEDNPDAGQSLCDLLAAMGHDAMVATDGPAALEMLGSRVPGVVLCDIGLPGMSGYDLAWAVRQQHADLPLLVAVTGYGQPEDQQRATLAGLSRTRSPSAWSRSGRSRRICRSKGSPGVPR
jgi:CheY-like chemotaxis protein